jgi:L-amino acid N-acyltransferase YncA
MPTSILEAASTSYAEIITELLMEMQAELKELDLNHQTTITSVTTSFQEGVTWFVFRDERADIFGCCHVQSLYNYWTLKRRYYLGGFYIRPTHRKQGRFGALNNQLQKWAAKNGGRQIYAHIHEDNQTSLDAFGAVGLEPVEYKLCVKSWD